MDPVRVEGQRGETKEQRWLRRHHLAPTSRRCLLDVLSRREGDSRARAAVREVLLFDERGPAELPKSVLDRHDQHRAARARGLPPGGDPGSSGGRIADAQRILAAHPPSDPHAAGVLGGRRGRREPRVTVGSEVRGAR